jgi:hypothetical protein
VRPTHNRDDPNLPVAIEGNAKAVEEVFQGGLLGRQGSRRFVWPMQPDSILVFAESPSTWSGEVLGRTRFATTANATNSFPRKLAE